VVKVGDQTVGYYSPITATLTQIVQDSTYQKIRVKETSEDPDNIQYFQDTGLYKKSKFFQENPDAIPLRIYRHSEEVFYILLVQNKNLIR
jgi:hypothetical protein